VKIRRPKTFKALPICFGLSRAIGSEDVDTDILENGKRAALPGNCGEGRHDLQRLQVQLMRTLSHVREENEFSLTSTRLLRTKISLANCSAPRMSVWRKCGSRWELRAFHACTNWLRAAFNRSPKYPASSGTLADNNIHGWAKLWSVMPMTVMREAEGAC
jgi:hypothetical protein